MRRSHVPPTPALPRAVCAFLRSEVSRSQRASSPPPPPRRTRGGQGMLVGPTQGGCQRSPSQSSCATPLFSTPGPRSRGRLCGEPCLQEGKGNAQLGLSRTCGGHRGGPARRKPEFYKRRKGALRPGPSPCPSPSPFVQPGGWGHLIGQPGCHSCQLPCALPGRDTG